ncbi:DUF4956 domain-containing protein [bacterium AH-315-N03]|nr:DUF4956 domain-containing protein [bacterium AH-315-N03]
MDELLAQIVAQTEGDIASFTVAELLLTFALAALLSIAITWVYRFTHHGTSYSRSFALSMVIMAVSIAFVMMVIGSNLARAFSLVGALAIIRFRNPVKESRDTAYIFLTMAVGMACGVRLWLHATIFTIASVLLMLLLDRLRFGERPVREHLLELRMPLDFEVPDDLSAQLTELLGGRADQLSSERLEDGRVLVFTLVVDGERAPSAMLDAVADRFEHVEARLLSASGRSMP